MHADKKKKSHLWGRKTPGRNADSDKIIYYNVWNNLTEGVGEGANLSNLGNEWVHKSKANGAAHEHCLWSIRLFPIGNWLTTLIQLCMYPGTEQLSK